jgi:SAM-dependent methyltransferase
MDLKEQAILAESIDDHWYYRAKLDAVRWMLRGVEARAILDVGAGSGFFAAQLLDRTAAAEAVCIDPGYPRDHDEVRRGKPLRFRRAPVPTEADCVLLLDVLEHVADERAFLSAYVEPARRGTHFLVTVPAFTALWSGHDVFLGHYRRYRLGQLEAVVAASGLELVRGRYFFGLVFPLAFARRLTQAALFRRDGARSDLRRHHPVVNGLLAAICRAERPLLAVNRLAGVSAMCLARKP